MADAEENDGEANTIITHLKNNAKQEEGERESTGHGVVPIDLPMMKEE